MQKYYLTIFIIGVLLFCTCVYYAHESFKNWRITIATIDSIKTTKVGGFEREEAFISYTLKNAKHHLVEGSFNYTTGQRIFIQVSPDGRGYGIAANCAVPDSIRVVPVDGWDKEWLNKNFPDCLLLNPAREPRMGNKQAH